MTETDRKTAPRTGGAPSAFRTAVRFLPAVFLAALMIWSFLTVRFRLDGESFADTAYIVGMIFMFGLTVILAIVGRSAFSGIVGALFCGAVPIVSFFLLELYIHDPIHGSPAVPSKILYLNILFFYLLFFFITALTTRTEAAVAVTAGIPMLFGLANYLAVQFRGTPIYPWDVLSFRTAVSVLDNYTPVFSTQFCFIVYTFVFMIGAGFLCGLRFRLKKPLAHGLTVLAAAAVFVGFCAYVPSKDAEKRFGYYPYLFSINYLYQYNGTAVTLLWSSQYLKLNEPAGYSAKEIDRLAVEYAPADEIIENVPVLPNIIVIMNETLSDLRVLGDFDTNVDYFPFIHSLSDNTAKGSVLVSVKGGNTPNSEFEFLTGTSMAFLPAGSIPFQQYVKTDIPTLVTQLRSLGYRTAALHPYGASGWDRDRVYPLLGFEEAYFRSDFSAVTLLRGYVSDSSMYRKIYDLYAGKEDGQPLFVFGVTMQNHGGYAQSYRNFTPTVTVDGLTNHTLSMYLSLMRASDQAFRELVSYFQKQEEPTIILMFGDHQPNDNVVEPILKMNGVSMAGASLDLEQTRYLTPYIVWTNYPLPELSSLPETLSVNYLAAELLSAAGIPLTPFQTWQLELIRQYPLLNANGYLSAGGDGYVSVQNIMKEPLLKLFAGIQYNLVFDTSHTVEEFFSLQKDVTYESSR